MFGKCICAHLSKVELGKRWEYGGSWVGLGVGGCVRIGGVCIGGCKSEKRGGGSRICSWHWQANHFFLVTLSSNSFNCLLFRSDLVLTKSMNKGRSTVFPLDIHHWAHSPLGTFISTSALLGRYTTGHIPRTVSVHPGAPHPPNWHPPVYQWQIKSSCCLLAGPILYIHTHT